MNPALLEARDKLLQPALMNLWRTHDIALVTELYRTCWAEVSDDSTPPDELASDSQIHLIASDADTLGVISFYQAWSGAWGIHVCFQPDKRANVRTALVLALAWLRENTPATCLMGIAAKGKPGIAATCRVLGMKPAGVLQRAFLRNGGTDAVIWQRAL